MHVSCPRAMPQEDVLRLRVATHRTLIRSPHAMNLCGALTRPADDGPWRQAGQEPSGVRRERHPLP
jgi:hypothetical protein